MSSAAVQKHAFHVLLLFCNIVDYLDCLSIHFYATASPDLDNYAPTASTMSVQTIGRFQCLYECAVQSNCLAIFYNSGDLACILLDTKCSNTNDLQSYPGMQYYEALPKTCSDIPLSQLPPGSNKLIDPDGTATELGPSTVWCDLIVAPGQIATILQKPRYNDHLDVVRVDVDHDHEDRTLVDGFEAAGSYSINLTYNAGFDVAKKVVDLSTGCKQKLMWECFSAMLKDGDEIVTFWRTRLMEQSTYFTGSGTTSLYCENCPSHHTCDTQTGCRCDLNTFEWAYDQGFVTNKNDLPMSGFAAGETGDHSNYDERGYHTIGPVICW